MALASIPAAMTINDTKLTAEQILALALAKPATASDLCRVGNLVWMRHEWQCGRVCKRCGAEAKDFLRLPRPDPSPTV